MTEIFIVQLDKPIEFWVSARDGREVRVTVSQTELDRNPPERYDGVLGEKLMTALVDIGIVEKVRV